MPPNRRFRNPQILQQPDGCRRQPPLAMAARVRFDGAMIWQIASDGGRAAEQERF
jgi:hypothetical protein